jgi:hypothetical protein
MKFVTFWRMQALELSLSERMFFRDAIRTLQAWEIVKKEYAELELIRKILETEINILPVDPTGEDIDKRNTDRPKDKNSHAFEKTL